MCNISLDRSIMKKSLLSALAVAAALSGTALGPALAPAQVIASPPSIQQRAKRPDLLATGRGTEPHIYGCGAGVYRARQYVRKYGLSRAMARNPKLEMAKVVEVPFTVCREINRSKWDGADLREIRARNGVGRPPRG